MLLLESRTVSPNQGFGKPQGFLNTPTEFREFFEIMLEVAS